MNWLTGLLPIDFGDCRQSKNDDDRNDHPCLANSEGIATEEAKHIRQNGPDHAMGEFAFHPYHPVIEYPVG